MMTPPQPNEVHQDVVRGWRAALHKTSSPDTRAVGVPASGCRRTRNRAAAGSDYPWCKIIEMMDFRLSRRAINALNVIGNAKWRGSFVGLFSSSASIPWSFTACAQGKPAHKDALLYFVWPQNGATIKGDFWCRFGLRNMGITHAGDNYQNSGHHHLLIDVNEPIDPNEPIPQDKSHLSFWGGPDGSAAGEGLIPVPQTAWSVSPTTYRNDFCGREANPLDIDVVSNMLATGTGGCAPCCSPQTR